MNNNVAVIIAILGAIAGAVSALVAWRALRANRHNTTLSTNYSHLAQAESLIGTHPELLELHNLPSDILTRVGISPIEAVYLIQSFTAADIYYRIGRSPQLTGYRQNMLKSWKTQRAWRELIRDRFISPGPLYELVESFLRDSPADVPLEKR